MQLSSQLAAGIHIVFEMRGAELGCGVSVFTANVHPSSKNERLKQVLDGIIFHSHSSLEFQAKFSLLTM